MLLGHTSIVESAISEDSFQMNFRLTHPLLGQIFCYRGRFKTVVTDESM
ncbi:MAG: DUF4166 domain-containing protein [Gammaproteobacteria bacterium]|nr:DUF4166 domain-containing protein [Gammaproteobacteria bacterium]